MLTNAAAKAAGAQTRAYKLTDQGGLHLLVRPTGTKSWQQKYRWRGREKLLTLGTFPELNVARARIAQAEAKEKLAAGTDPSTRTARLDKFEDVARAWHSVHAARWSEVHAADVLASLERDVFPQIGMSAAGDIGAAELVRLLESVERSGRVETAKRLRQRLSQIFTFAQARELIDGNPASGLKSALAGVSVSQPHPALTDIAGCRALLAACEGLDARPVTCAASRFLALTAVRLNAVRGMCWDEVEDLEGSEPIWRIPAARMKLARAKKALDRFDHIVPLSPAATIILKNAYMHSRNANLHGLVFPGRTLDAPIGEGTLRELYIRAGYEGRHVPHGWRASFSSILNEKLGENWRTDIDRALAHAGMGKVEAAYNRSEQLGRRRELMCRWGAMLDGTI